MAQGRKPTTAEAIDAFTARLQKERDRQRRARARKRLSQKRDGIAEVRRALDRAGAPRPCQNTSIERRVQELLGGLSIEYQTHVRFGRWECDVLVPSLRLVIECDGDYWHSLPGAAGRDSRKDAYLTNAGYRVLRLSESKINDLTVNTFRKIIERY